MSNSPRDERYDALRDGHVTDWFLGPQAEHEENWRETLRKVFADYVHWRRNVSTTDPPVVPSHLRDQGRWQHVLQDRTEELLRKLKSGDYPFYHPRYLAHMLSEQTLPSVLGWFAGVLYNANNVTDEAAPVTVTLELEVGAMVAKMLGYNPHWPPNTDPDRGAAATEEVSSPVEEPLGPYTERAWAHITSGGTIANLEALWVARTVQFTPFALRDLGDLDVVFRFPEEADPQHVKEIREVRDSAAAFTITLPDGQSCLLSKASNHQLLRLAPSEAIAMPWNLQAYLTANRFTPALTSSMIKKVLADSPWNVARSGFATIAKRLSTGRSDPADTRPLLPVVLAPATAHYSIDKACNVLGYGEDALKRIPIDAEHFRMDVDALAEAIEALNPDEYYVAAVIAVVGTTEEGAVDPVHAVRDLRDRLSQGSEGVPSQSFWLHADAAWGGYAATLFRGHHQISIELPEADKPPAYAQEISKIFPGKDTWYDKDVYAAFLAMPSAESITVDPHKLGYVPYPAGIVAFRDLRVTTLIGQRANYIRHSGDDAQVLANPPTVKGVGEFILEGSKPGAAAASCWLAHKAIPLEAAGHGRIIHDTLLAAKRLASSLRQHEHDYVESGAHVKVHVAFTLIYEPDMNVVCFIVQPKTLSEGKLVQADGTLQELNEINTAVHKRLGSPAEREQVGRMPYGHPFYLSRTRLEDWQYKANTIMTLLRCLGIKGNTPGATVSDEERIGEYMAHGLVVLRSTVMSPYYGAALDEAHEHDKRDYIEEFVATLHVVAREVIDDALLVA